MNGCIPGEIGYSLPDDTPVTVAITKAGAISGCLKVYIAGSLQETHHVSLVGYMTTDEKTKAKGE